MGFFVCLFIQEQIVKCQGSGKIFVVSYDGLTPSLLNLTPTDQVLASENELAINSFVYKCLK